MESTLRAMVALGIALLLVMLRLEAERFGAAEYDEATAGHLPALRRRLSWYALGLILLFVIFVAYPAPRSDLHLTTGDRLEAILFGLGFGAVGTAQAVAFAWLRYRRLRLPEPKLYAGAVVNALGTALIDEAAFRGVLMGFVLLAGVDGSTANVIQALLYALATRLGAPGRDRYMLVLVLLIGLAGGWLTLATGGIGAAFVGHSITRFATFLTTGHPGRVALPGHESEDVERVHRPPEGWQVVPDGARRRR